jgi:PhoPQ-activated pathogenicity-related protein
MVRYLQLGKGAIDCTHWVARCVDFKRGTRYEEEIRRRFPYNTVLEAARIVRKHGGMNKMIEEYLGPPQSWLQCTNGDPVLARLPHHQSIEVVGIKAPQQILLWTHKGILGFPLDTIIWGWPWHQQ